VCVCSEMEVFTQYHPIPFSKMLTFYRKEPFALQAVYTHPPNVPVSQPLLGMLTLPNCTFVTH
jgi:heat shock protein 4